MRDWLKKAGQLLVNILISPITIVLSLIMGINLLKNEIKKRKDRA
ncbi:MAG: hypothetical protein ACI4F1_12285 [Bariatricus sp.]